MTEKEKMLIGDYYDSRDSELIKMYINSDLIIWSFPLYYFGMPSKIKAFLDRLLPTSLPSINIKENQSCGHPGRYDLSHQMHLLISSCGFYSVKGNYDALFKQFEIGISTNLYLPAIGTAGLDRAAVKGNNLDPAPPPSMIARISFECVIVLIAITNFYFNDLYKSIYC